jgi:hypothetical protein
MTSNAVKENELGDRFRIEANGGYGTGSYFAGSGGVVVFDGGFEVRP